MKRLIFLIWFSLGSLALFATHNRAGEITYRHISGLTYEVTVNVFSDPTSPAFQRKEIVIDWGDNTGSDSIPQTIVYPKLADNIQKRSWIVRHTYPGPGNYYISVADPNRNGGVDNIENSSGVPFYLRSLLRISPLGSLRNNSPILLNDPIDNACAGQIFTHNPGAVDPDGDSLAYELSPSFGAGGQTAPGFTYPPSSTPIYVDAKTGDMVMNVPFLIGLYNVAILIKEYRNNILVGTVLRDLQIQVFPGCNNSAPQTNANSLYCVEAGRQLSFAISATDPNQADDIRLTATGEPFILSGNPAGFNQTVLGNPSSATFIWNTNCSNARQKLYDISIKAEDNAIENRNATTNLTSFKSVVVRVIAPGPENAIAAKQGIGVQLNWDNIACPNASGFKIYRKIDSSGYQSGNCIPGIPEGIGYQLIQKIENINTTSYLDDDGGDGLIPGRKYCYFITKFFSDGDESYVSDEVCAEIEKIIPLMTKVSVVQTDLSTGEIQLGWSPPDSIDANLFPPPYRYLIEQRQNGAVQILDSTASLIDTTYLATNLNTFNQRFEYRVGLYSLGSGRRLAGKSPWASSKFIELTPSDNQIRIDWSGNVSWINTQFTIYRKLPNANQFDSIAQIDSTYFIDENLVNGQRYTYFIRTIGSYEINSVDSPLVNLSQEAYTEPIDNTPPCSPAFNIKADCSFGELEINWSVANAICVLDIVSYRIYRSEGLKEEFQLIEEINDPTVMKYNSSNDIAGCYFVSAIDSAGNESVFSKRECVEYCPIYELPNVFTPNGDGKNDIYVPLPNYRYVDSVNFQVFNRWDQRVFKTQNPQLNWNGLNSESDELISDGIYFYICEVFEQSIEGPQKRILKGTISVINSKEAQNFK